ncbi:MAG: acyl-CoA dehydrogenase family protein [Dermatophilaceae bacterium]
MTARSEAASLAARLGDADAAGRALHWQRSLSLDHDEAFPVDACAELDLAGVAAHYVPTRHGGRLDRYDVAGELLGVLARRDLTVAIAHAKTFLGAASVWVGGSPEQADRLGAWCCQGERVSWGLTERDHGADLLATEVRAVRDGEGYRLSGEKWLINNARRGRFACTLAVTSRAAGPRGLSLFLIDHHEAPPGTIRSLPRARLHGIRGADISGMRYLDTPVPAGALVGAEGAGLEIVLRTLALTRVMCAPLSAGAAEHALDLAVRHTLTARRFGARVCDLPFSLRRIGEAAADLLLAQVVTRVAARSVHTLPGELAVTSAVTKYLVPVLGQAVVSCCGSLLGAHGLLLDHPFQKVARDHRIVGIFDGSAVVNLHALVVHFPALLRGWKAGRVDPGLGPAADLRACLPEADLAALRLSATRGSSMLTSLPVAAARLADDALPCGVTSALQEILTITEGRLAATVDVPPLPWTTPAAAFDIAADLAWASAAAVVCGWWQAGERWDRSVWLDAVLLRILDRLAPAPGAPTRRDCLDVVGREVLAAVEAGELPPLVDLVGGAHLGRPVCTSGSGEAQA